MYLYMEDKYIRNCPLCDKKLSYSTKRNLQRAIDNDKGCQECKTMPESAKQKLSEYWTGRKRPTYPKTRSRTTKFSKWSRECPDCGKVRYYSSNWHLKNAIANDTVCDGCANYKYTKTWNDVITDDNVKQMRATKAGFKNWEEYLEKMPDKKQYKLQIIRLTNLLPIKELSKLPNYDKPRGLNGVEGAYQRDHIISIDEGYKRGIPPEEIATTNNIQYISWEENRQKSNKLELPDLDYITLADDLPGSY